MKQIPCGAGLIRAIFSGLDRIGEFLPQLGLRLLLAYEFWQSGEEKWNGMKWLGYNVCDNGWKLPLIYLVMFLPLLFSGPGKLSLDHLIRRQLVR